MKPSYLALAESGELARRAETLREKYACCDLCPRLCRANRLDGKIGYCKAGTLASVASVNPHHGEEPPITGTRASGTVFFDHCTLRCVYCQNFRISQGDSQHEISDAELAEAYLELQRKGCHNLNLVTPTHYLPSIVSALCLAVKQGFELPIVYNSSGYERVETLQLLDGIVDIYLPDCKYSDPKKAAQYSDAPNYMEANLTALREMHRQVGRLLLDDDDVALRGLLVRHLVLPGAAEDSIKVLQMLEDSVSPTLNVSVMSQYFPTHRAKEFPPLDRRVSREEYERVVEWMAQSTLRGFVQPLG
ncbi:TPA: radical SAM protein [Candidatus Sumerlaeota bacterium]|jgi:putative pyruvate formate lyase activating enzyme|nr:radical SAM protein [Candidatus Sumerlaeota bacterium]